MSTDRLTLRTALLLSIPPLLWAGNAVVGRLAVGLAPPVALNGLLWLIAFALLWPLGWRAWTERAALRRHAGYLAWLGLLGMGSYNALQYLALHSSTPLNVTLIAASSPVWSLAIGALVYRVMPRWRDGLGAALSLLGVALVIGRGEPARLLQLHFALGDVLMVVAIVCWSFYSWLLARPPQGMAPAERPARWDWAGFLHLQIGFGLLWSLAGAGAEAGLAQQWLGPWPHWQWTPALAAVLLYVAVGPSLIAYRCWGLGVAAAGPAVAGFFVNLTPLFAAVFSTLWLGEAPHGYHAAAFALIVGGILASARR